MKYNYSVELPDGTFRFGSIEAKNKAQAGHKVRILYPKAVSIGVI